MQESGKEKISSPRLPQLGLTRFDRLVGIVIAILIGIIVLTIALGDRVGVQIAKIQPLGTATITEDIQIQFSTNMLENTVERRLRVEPEIEGAFSWSGETLTFSPQEPLQPEASYTVILEAGSEAENGRLVNDEYRYEFTVRSPRVAYLAPANNAPVNVWIADPADPESAEQITFAEDGVFNFAVSPDGRKVAYSERDFSEGTSNLFLLDLETGGIQQLTDCRDSDCTSPIWRPDGKMIAYERSSQLSPNRIWLLDMTAEPFSTRPLFSNSQMLGYGAQWSGDGEKIALYESNALGTVVFDLVDGEDLKLVPNQHGSTGSFAPDGTRLVFPEPSFEVNNVRVYLRIADLEVDEIRDLTDQDEAVDDDSPVWHPDGERIAFSRQYQDNRYTPGRQLYVMDTRDQSVEPLVVDAAYNHSSFSWHPDGDQILVQRFPMATDTSQPDPDATAQVWLYDLENDELILIADNAFLPQWAP